MSEYTPTIGIEIHVQLATKSKMFCACDNDSVQAKPNTHICPICMAYPGTLPLPNRRAIELAIRLGLGLNATISRDTKFDRKNYFYPDSPKGYQITQFDQPIVENGSVEIFIDGEFKTIGVERAHLEEDAGKLTHPIGKDYSLVDLNRAGTPLLEIVSRPDMHSPAEARRYLQEVYAIATSLGVTHGNMQHGNMKFDLNVSVSKDDTLGTRTELKNLNSFRNAERALTYEIDRQVKLLESGESILQETRGWNDAKGKTFAQRSKEEAHDYRYFPEPDIPPLVITEDMIDAQKQDFPMLPIEIRRELVELGLSAEEQDILISQPFTSALFAQAQKQLEAKSDSLRKLVNILVGDYQAWLKTKNGPETDLTLIEPPFSAEQISELVRRIVSGELSSKMAKQVLHAMFETSQDPAAIIDRLGLVQVSDEGQLRTIITDLIAKHPQAVQDYQSGNAKAIGFFVGQVMQQTKGQANPQTVNELLKTILDQA
ncbi:Asp-tRNA(Asn)/Glu-tRNA(Gln) amidotransferase subunit GatB [Candidatus Saccharibacteria bacterium]|nr:Asp-tRNA(Asn)/Glu-tRNA(Gln) amidotransferase subunit GatB [Candidatus Saccharibacteria bacterium]